jgi:hypothetical protein
MEQITNSGVPKCMDLIERLTEVESGAPTG